tara:strand:- start:806 stop:1291 length:486 start_codon:yes stop_codon:yes gene_type:complete
MSYLYDGGNCQDDYVPDLIKPKLIAKIPYQFGENGFGPLEKFIAYSPGLEFFVKQGCLITVVRDHSTQFFTDCRKCFEKYQKTFTENVALVNLKEFARMMDEQNESAAPVTKKLKTQEEILNDLQKRNNSNCCDNEEAGSIKRASDILKLIRSRKRKRDSE